MTRRLARWLERGPPMRRWIAIVLCGLWLYAMIHAPAYIGLLVDEFTLSEWRTP